MIRKVYLVGVAQQETNRRLFEDTFGRELALMGVTGISSYRQLPPQELDSKEAIVEQVRRRGCDSILMARMTSLRTEQVARPEYVTGSYFAPAPYYRSWDSYYDNRYEAIFQPSPVSEFQIATIEANLYEAQTGRLIWSAQLETVIEGDFGSLFSDFVRTVIKDLRKQGLF